MTTLLYALTDVSCQIKVCFQTLIEPQLCPSSQCLLIKLVYVPSLVSAISWLFYSGLLASYCFPSPTYRQGVCFPLAAGTPGGVRPIEEDSFWQFSCPSFRQQPTSFIIDRSSRLFGLGYALGLIKRDKDDKPIFKIVHCGSKGSLLLTSATPPLSWNVLQLSGRSRNATSIFEAFSSSVSTQITVL